MNTCKFYKYIAYLVRSGILIMTILERTCLILRLLGSPPTLYIVLKVFASFPWPGIAVKFRGVHAFVS